MTARPKNIAFSQYFTEIHVHISLLYALPEGETFCIKIPQCDKVEMSRGWCPFHIFPKITNYNNRDWKEKKRSYREESLKKE